MSQLFTKCCSSKSGNHALDSQEYMKKGNNLLNWKMPKIPTTTLYKRSNKFSFFLSDPSIKISEARASFGNGNRAIRLINPIMNAFESKRFYDMFNVGLVQIGVKTLTKKIPQNASITLIVRDARHDKIEGSILGLVKANLGDGPLYFNVFPNMTMPLFDNESFGALVLNVIVKGFEQLLVGAEPISLMVRTVCKLQSDEAPSALLESPDGKTVFFQTDVEGSNETVQRVTAWDKVVCNLVLSGEDKKAQS